MTTFVVAVRNYSFKLVVFSDNSVTLTWLSKPMLVKLLSP